MRLRPYGGWNDLPVLQRLVAEGTRDAPERGCVHPGDVAWWIGWHPCRELPDAIVLAEHDGRTVGWALDDEGDVREYVHQALLDTPDAGRFADAVEAWIDTRADRSRPLERWADDDDAAAVSGVGNVESVGTHAEHARRGFGRAVMAEGLRRPRDAGMTTAIVRTGVGNDPAAGLYRSLGFRRRRTWHVYSRP